MHTLSSVSRPIALLLCRSNISSTSGQFTATPFLPSLPRPPPPSLLALFRIFWAVYGSSWQPLLFPHFCQISAARASYQQTLPSLYLYHFLAACLFVVFPHRSYASDSRINNTNASHLLTLAVDIKRELLSGAIKWRKWEGGYEELP